MAKTLEQIQAELEQLKTQFSDFSALSPVSYYTHQYSGEEIDESVGVTQGTVPTLVRPNLLDNWYFGRPVNQRGETEYSPNWDGYTIDRWSAEMNAGDMTVAVTGNGLRVKNSSTYQRQLKQILDNDTTLVGETMTASVLVESVSGNVAISYAQTQTPYQNSIGFINLTGPGLYSGTGRRKADQHKVVILLDPGAEITLLAAKLELGPTQTLAHKEGDRWVLNEIPDYGEQLRRCQRYCRVIGGTKNQPFCNAVRREATVLEGFIPIDNPFRTRPSISVNDYFTVIPDFHGVKFTSGDTLSPQCVSLFFARHDGGTFDKDVYLIYAGADTRITLSADL